MLIKVRPDLKLRHPQTKQFLPQDEVIEVPDGDLFWHRRLNDGDVVLVQPPADPAEPSTAAKAAANRRSKE